MYQFTFDEDTTKKVESQTTKTKSILEQFSEVDNKYSSLSSLGQSDLNLQELTYQKPTDEEVKTKAENSLSEYKNSSISSINSNFDTKNKNINVSIESAKQAGEEDAKKIYSTYQNVKQDAKDDAIKRGLARSSIIVNTLASYDNGMLAELSNKSEEVNAKITAYQNEKNLLEEQKQNALSSFDIEYAVKLQEKIDSINQSIQEKEQEVIKYNNDIAEIKAKWEKEQESENFDKTTELAELMGKYGVAVFDELKQNEKYALLQNHFKDMPKEEALNELKNNTAYISNIGKYNYNKLLQELNDRLE